MDADADGPGPTLLAAAETDDVGNVDGRRREEEAEEEAELCPRLSLVTTDNIQQWVRTSEQLLRKLHSRDSSSIQESRWNQ